MTPEAQCKAIAKLRGWTKVRITKYGVMIGHPPKDQKLRWDVIVPNYPEDLNACHDMEKMIPDNLRDRYHDVLSKLEGYNYRRSIGERNEHLAWCVSAPAAQRAEAFLRTLNLWEDSE